MKSENGLLLLLTLGLFGVPIAASYDMATTEKPSPVASDVDTRDEQRELMDALLNEVDRENLLRAVEHVESHGDPNAVSAKGAKGRYQLMDGTARKPGMGVTPMRNRSQKEQKRFARDYLNALLEHYHGNVRLALAAYNGGVGRVDRVLAQLPKETQDYVQKVQEFAENGE